MYIQNPARLSHLMDLHCASFRFYLESFVLYFLLTFDNANLLLLTLILDAVMALCLVLYTDEYIEDICVYV